MTHERIWAPWRLAYIRQLGEQPEPAPPGLQLLPGAEPTCFICLAVADSEDRARHVVRRGEHSVTILNRYPYNNGHLMVAPRFHRARLDQLNSDEQLELSAEISRMVNVLEKVLCAQGFNIGLNLGRVAGAGLPEHLHWHIVPRWNGDTNFMATLASIKVIPQSLDALWEALTAELP